MAEALNLPGYDKSNAEHVAAMRRVSAAFSVYLKPGPGPSVEPVRRAINALLVLTEGDPHAALYAGSRAAARVVAARVKATLNG